MVKYILLVTASCNTVTCSFTIDNVVEWAKYDGNTLPISVPAHPGTTSLPYYQLSIFGVKKSVTFESCYDSSPGTLRIKGSNANGKGCLSVCN